MTSIINFLKSQKRLTMKKILSSELKHEFEIISNNIKSLNPHEIIYHYVNRLSAHPTCKCGNNLAWNNDLKSYRKYCSRKCTALFSVEDKKEKNLKNIGVEWHSQTRDWHDKVKNTSEKLYGKEHFSKTDSFKDSVKRSVKTKYNVDHVMHLSATKEKIKSTNQKRYGVDNPAQNKEIQEKIKSTNQKRYGEFFVLKNKEIQEKIKSTNQKRYGVDNPAQNKEVRERIVNTRQKNYYPVETLTHLKDANWLQNQNVNGKSIGEIAKELSVSPSNLGKIYHKLDLNIVRHQHSSEENIVYNHFCKDYNISRNCRDAIPPKEIDIFFNEYNLGVEINGIYFHSEKFNKAHNYHINKTLTARKSNINLLHFWDFEVNNKPNLVVNTINSHLGILSNKVDARKTNIKLISKKEKKYFLDCNHLQGNIGSTVDLGLIHCDKIVAVATFSKNRFSKKADYELLRLCSLLNTSVRGGASKLINYFIKNYMKKDEKLISYADRRYSNGNVYKAIGFDFVNYSPPGFFYINKNGTYAGTRYQWQKHLLKDKLENFDVNLSAHQNMKNHDYEKVWDCGQAVYVAQKIS